MSCVGWDRLQSCALLEHMVALNLPLAYCRHFLVCMSVSWMCSAVRPQTGAWSMRGTTQLTKTTCYNGCGKFIHLDHPHASWHNTPEMHYKTCYDHHCENWGTPGLHKQSGTFDKSSVHFTLFSNRAWNNYYGTNHFVCVVAYQVRTTYIYSILSVYPDSSMNSCQRRVQGTSICIRQVVH